MPTSPERKPVIEVRPEEIETIPEYLEKGGVRPVQSQFKAQVKYRGRNLIQSPAAKTITIQLPTDQQHLAQLAKGSSSNSITWLALFWLRLIKKAAHFGWRVVLKKNKS